MKIGISVPNNWGVEDPHTLVELGVQAEARGFASLWTSEHLINLAYVRARIGERPYFHPLAILSALAARTSRIALGTSVVVLPFHNPFDIAKYVATVDQLSRGRVILGVGVGNVREEFDVLGIPWEKRGAITDESIDVLQALWGAGVAKHDGPTWSFTDIHTSPKPYQRDAVPIWIGGMSPAAFRRVARVGDGWHPTAVTPDQFRAQAEEIRGLAAAAGRDPAGIEMCMRFNISLDEEIVTETELKSTVKGDDISRIVSVAENFAAAGATHFIYALNSHEPQVLTDTVNMLADRLLPRFA